MWYKYPVMGVALLSVAHGIVTMMSQKTVIFVLLALKVDVVMSG